MNDRNSNRNRTRDRIKDKDKTNTKHKVIDLRKATNPDDDTYICEYCDCRLIPYFDIKGERKTRGKLFQCGKCGQIKDTSYNNLQRPENLYSKGDENSNIFVTNWRQPQPTRSQPFDIDPGDDLMYKGMGFHIVRTRITVGGKVLRDDFNLDA